MRLLERHRGCLQGCHGSAHESIALIEVGGGSDGARIVPFAHFTRLDFVFKIIIIKKSPLSGHVSV